MTVPKWADKARANDDLIRRALGETDFAVRIAARLEPDGDCLLWSGATNEHGYGVIMIPLAVTGRPIVLVRVHRVAYIDQRGSIPHGFSVDHLCSIRRCANVAHLEPVPHQVNVARSDFVGRRREDWLSKAQSLVSAQWGGVA